MNTIITKSIPDVKHKKSLSSDYGERLNNNKISVTSYNKPSPLDIAVPV